MAATTTAVAKPPAHHQKSGLIKWLPMVVLSLALMIIIVDTTVLNVSLKAISEDLDTNLTGLQWVITAYALTLAALTITGGRLGDLFGRKKMFMLGAVIFAVGSFITSISHSVGMMIAGESVIEGVGAALMMPATASLLVAMYKGRDRAIAFGIWGGIAGAASAIGPIIGGFLTTNYSWRWAFRINIVVVAVLLVGSLAIAESVDRAEKRQLDIIGVILSAAGLLSFVYGIIESSTYGWWASLKPYSFAGIQMGWWGHSVTVPAIALGLLLLAAFAWWENYTEKRGNTPLVSLSLFKNLQFTSGASTVALMSLGMTGLIFALPVFLQSVQNLDALHTGLALVPLSLTILVVAPSSALLAKHFTAKRIIQAGLLIAVAASVLLRGMITPTATAADLAPGLALFGLGLGLVFAQASNLTLSAVSVEQAGEAAGVNNTMRQIGATFGSAIIGTVVLTTFASGVVKGIQDSPVFPAAFKPLVSQAVSSSSSDAALTGLAPADGSGAPPAITTELTRISHQASAQASRTAVLYTGVFLLGAFAMSFALPNVRDLEKRGRQGAQPAAGH